eukprot:TRINITY_DN6654_c0_g1_i1.p4 TRINITY_DN6654_c0_g1~~TRINITY_DN6654_c0_g1_i1.p4  ORF type:complete len:111 (-),score=11.71 TRINITY_DN6654_c0_g1_i1:153-485(-)
MYIIFPVVSTRMTLNDIVIRDQPANIPQAPKNANVPGKKELSKTFANLPINLPQADPKIIPGTNNPLGTDEPQVRQAHENVTKKIPNQRPNSNWHCPMKNIYNSIFQRSV